MSFAEKMLNLCQKINDKIYEREGLTEKCLKNQIKINELRAKHNLHYADWVQ